MRRLPILQNKPLLAALLSMGCAAAVGVFSGLGAFEGLELKTLDFRQRLFPPGHGAAKDVVLVAIDDKSLDDFKRNDVVWKWPRDFYGAIVDYLRASGAKVIVFDEIFSDPDIDRKGTDGVEEDKQFAAAIRRAGNVVLGAQPQDVKNLTIAENEPGPEAGVRVEGTPPPGVETYRYAAFPIGLLQKSALATGAVLYKEDKDGICRRSAPLFLYKGLRFPTLGLAAYLAAKGASSVRFPDARTLEVAGERIPLDPEGRLLLRWYGPGGINGPFKYYSYSDVMRSKILQDSRAPGAPVPPSALKGKIVMIGATAAGLLDYRTTPFTTGEPYPGMEIHATLASNLLERDFVRRLPPWLGIAGVLLMSALVCGLFFFEHGIAMALVGMLACGAAWILAANALFASRGLWLDIVAPEAGLVLAFAASAAVSYEAEGKARRQLRKTFSRYLSPVVIKEVLEQKEGLELGGQDVTGTVFFSDIKDFTSTSERLTPQELVHFLNKYFGRTSDVILQKKGLIDKYIGDAIMAVFGAPVPIKEHAALACEAALEIQKILREAPPGDLRGRASWTTRIGINSGPMVVGNIGSPNRLDYTAIGDTVNLASRLEGANKSYGTSILISETTFQELGGAFETRELDLLAVKGKDKALLVYELLGRKGEIDPDALRLKQIFESAARWYRERSFEKALSAFESALAAHPGDAAALLYLERCKRCIESRPGADWDGVYHSHTK